MASQRRQYGPRARTRVFGKTTALALLLCLESVVVITALVLFGVAYPDRFRSRLWRNGGEEGWSSNPRLRIYFYANFEEVPQIPLIWSQRLTTSNTAIAVLSFPVLFARITMAALQYESRWTNIAYDVLLAALWAFSAVAQNGSDLTDPQHLMERPWYLTRTCDEAWSQNRGWCKIAKWEYGWAIVAASFYTLRIIGALGLSVYEKGKRDGGQNGLKESLMDEWTWDDQDGRVAPYKDVTVALASMAW
ncbi:uncharacterized protein CTRU02_208507 [Colletotrichum truncatum]|uniref:Uncharacterized protein n=1 Tax=Colletotrichum truncatum TaxID=5467 RepID=A0ACC3YWX3_COLTU|nr:uncharacterized protein CTRU02_10262 [Colletotrichum truncatum]KAF6787466.1 hypothetical protein CTRU02_10262 [Colletotrichum truncatum]